MDFHLDAVLNLPNVPVFTSRQESNLIILQLDLLNQGINCPHCQKYTDDLNQNRPIFVKDLAICGQGVYLQVPRRQFYCSSCSRYSTETLDWMEKGRNYTKRSEAYLYEKVKELPVELVSRSEGISAQEVQGIFTRIARLKKRLGQS